MIKSLNNKGIGLVEVIAALGITTVVITSLVSLSVFTLRSSLRSKLLLEGSKTANRELELIRAYRDSVNWSDFTNAISGCTTGLCSMNLDGSGVISTVSTVNAGQPEEVTRSFKTAISGSVVQVTVTVNWKDAGTTKSTTLYTELSNWQGK